MQAELPYTFKNNALFFKSFYNNPAIFIKTLTPGTDSNRQFKLSRKEEITEQPNRENVGHVEKDVESSITLNVDVETLYNDVYSHVSSILYEKNLSRPKWFWELDIVGGKYIANDFDKGLVGIDIFFPSSMSPDGGSLAFPLSCPASSSILIYKDSFKVGGENIDIMSSLQQGDHLYSYCNDKVCSSLGRACAIVR